MEISRKVKHELLEKYKKEENIWKLTKNQLKENASLNEENIELILEVKKRKNLEKIYLFMQKNSICVIQYKEKSYPKSLKNIEDFPIYIMVRGNIENLYSDNIGIVGARNASKYGKNISRNLAYNLTEKNINIVSGLAIRD